MRGYRGRCEVNRALFPPPLLPAAVANVGDAEAAAAQVGVAHVLGNIGGHGGGAERVKMKGEKGDLESASDVSGIFFAPAQGRVQGAGSLASEE